MESLETHPKEHPETNRLADIQHGNEDLENTPDTQSEHLNAVDGEPALPSPHLNIQPSEQSANMPTFYSDVPPQTPEESGSSIQDVKAPQEPPKPKATQTQATEQAVPIETVPSQTVVAKEEQIPESVQPSVAPVNRPGDDEVERKLNEEQLKYCDVVLKSLKKHRDAGPFSVPVDPIALGIPDYPMIIKNPMDLSTVERKLLETKEYKSADEFISDIKLMLNNCYTYNPPETIVYKRGKNLEKQLENALKKMPTKESILASSQAPAVAAGAADKKRKSSTTSLAGPTSFCAAPGPKQRAVAHAASPSTGGETPKPRRSASVKQGTKSFTEEMKHCMNVWKEITKKANIVWPFMQPVDPVALGIPDYFPLSKNQWISVALRRK